MAISNQYGFEFGAAKVVRLTMINGHAVLLIETKRQELYVRITPTGFIRLDNGGPEDKKES